MTVDEGSYVHVTSDSGLVHDEGAVVREGEPVPGSEGSPLSWFQERLWIHYLRDPENTSYNLPLMLLVEGSLDVSVLEQSLSEIVGRHESLRTYYGQTVDGEPVQFIAPAERVRLPVIAVEHARMLEQLERHLEHRIDLRQGPNYIATFLHLSDDRHLL